MLGWFVCLTVILVSTATCRLVHVVEMTLYHGGNTGVNMHPWGTPIPDSSILDPRPLGPIKMVALIWGNGKGPGAFKQMVGFGGI